MQVSLGGDDGYQLGVGGQAGAPVIQRYQKPC